MPYTCDNCGSEYPVKKEIDGKVRNLQSRRYCLDCSPFGEHNTTEIDGNNVSGGIEECESCGREYKYDRSKGHRHGKCNSCYIKEKRQRKKKELVEELGGECMDCGYNECLRALCFHHRDPDKKEFELSESIARRNWDSVLAEAEKCDLLCRNCHNKRHCDYC